MNALTKSESSIAVPYTRDQIDLMKRTVCKGATDDEFSMFLHQCQRTGLDPFSKQIHAVKRWQDGREVMSIQTGIDGFRLVAGRTGEVDGQDGPYWCGKDGEWHDVWLGDGAPIASKVIVYRKNCAHPFTGVARYLSYVQKKKDGEPNSIWRTLPDVMLAKCAEALALRKAFPQELSGLYTHDEMAQSVVDPEPEQEKIIIADRGEVEEPPKKSKRVTEKAFEEIDALSKELVQLYEHPLVTAEQRKNLQLWLSDGQSPLQLKAAILKVKDKIRGLEEAKREPGDEVPPEYRIKEGKKPGEEMIQRRMGD